LNVEVYRCGFKVHSFDSDAFGAVTAPRLLGYLLESAGGSADALGFGIEALQRQGLTWVLGRIQIVVDARIAVGDALEVETWPSGLLRSAAMRDFRIRRAGLEVGRATSTWFVLDMATRLPERPGKLLPERLRPQTQHLVALSPVIAPMPEPATLARPYDVRKSDIDLNQHVTAASYVGWAMEAIPNDLWSSHRLASLDVQFVEECHLGGTIVTEAALVEDGILLHRISRCDDGKELTRLRTTWVLREST
jgi:medium-chain acyl-[acyl-carrier-protein] hydrolase